LAPDPPTTQLRSKAPGTGHAQEDIKTKKAGFGLEMRTFEGSKGTYIVFKLPKDAFHAFVETEATDAAIDCGSALSRAEHTQTHWKKLWHKACERGWRNGRRTHHRHYRPLDQSVTTAATSTSRLSVGIRT
jgi:hypothetical protein